VKGTIQIRDVVFFLFYWSANNVGNAGPHVRQTFLNDVFTFLTEVGSTGRIVNNDYFIKVWFQLSNWFQTRRFLCEFPIVSYVKLSSAVGAILVGGLKCQTYFGRGPPKNHFSKVWLRLAQ
jgi:hypothetical protein